MFRKILYPTDFSPSAKYALEYVKKLKEAGTEEVVLLHVYDERDIEVHWEVESEIHPEETVEKAKHDVVKKMLSKNYLKLKEIEDEIAHLGYKTELIVEEGIPFEKIVKTAEDLNVSVIVMGSHGVRGFLERMLGSTTGRVLQRSDIPVLVVKPPKEDR